MTPTERDRERADKFRDEVERIYDNWCDVECRASDLFDRIAEAHAAALADVRREAMTECAEIAAKAMLVPPDGGAPTSDEVRMCEVIEREIRAKIGGE